MCDKASCQKDSPYELERTHPNQNNERVWNQISVCGTNQCINYDNNAIECNKLARFIFRVRIQKQNQTGI